MSIINVIVKMQIAIDYEKDRYVTPAEAKRGVDYHCTECDGVVRVRRRKEGLYFRHYEKCGRNPRSKEDHMAIQRALFQLMPHTRVEYPIEGVKRKGDVVDPKRRFVYEVQCSPITVAEVQNRERDYQSAGYRIIWILHDYRFNRKGRRRSAAERYIREHLGCYYAYGGTLQVLGFYDTRGRKANLRIPPDRHPLPPSRKKRRGLPLSEHIRTLYIKLLEFLEKGLTRSK